MCNKLYTTNPMLMSSIKGLDTLTSSSNHFIITIIIIFISIMFHSVASAASKVAGAASDAVSGTITFSEHEVMKHVSAFNGLSSRSAAQQYVVKEFENIKETAPEDAVVDVDVIPAAAAAGGGSDLKNVVLKVSPKNTDANKKNSSIVVSSGFFVTEAHDNSSSVAVMLELARAVSHRVDGIKSSVIFFYNASEEESGLNAAHTFMDQNIRNQEIRLAIDLEGLGLGGNKPADNQASGGLRDPVVVLYGNNGEDQQPLKQGIFPAQTKNMKENPLTLQDIFNERAVKSTTDFQQGLGATAVHHPKNDKSGPEWEKESIINLGENMLTFLLQVGSTTEFE